MYRQTIGIPMEQNVHLSWQTCSYFITNVHENLMHDNLCMVKRFSNTVRYIDDLLTLNNTV